MFGFVVASASFVGSTGYSDARLADVARRSHQVSDHAMPSIVEVSLMRRELARVHSILDESAEGAQEELRMLDAHLQDLGEAWAAYEALRFFPGEIDLSRRARAKLDDVLRLVGMIHPLILRGSLADADRLVSNEFAPAVREADASLDDIVRFNRDQARLAADEADLTWSRARRLAILLDFLCVAITAALAYAALRSTRRYEAMMASRATELGDFADRVAHDIRAPLAPVLMSLQLVGRDLAEHDAKREVVDRAIRSVRRIDRLVTDLLTFASSGAEPEPEAHASLRVAATSVVEDLEPQAFAARVRIDCDALPACEVACAPGVLTSILLNLVGNAIKHMPDEWPTRVIRLHATVLGPRVRVEVTDTGAGIGAELQERVFEPRVRGTTNKPGLGLGLSTVRRLVTAHGGAVGVRSRIGDGTTLWFELPVR